MKTVLIVLVIILLLGAGIYAFTNDGNDTGAVACTMDAKLCPDGSYVGRTGPNCEFALCPGEPASTGTAATSTGIIQSVTNASSTLNASTSISLPKTITVNYTSTGFSPKTVIIAKGGTVKFVNSSSEGMWIASDPHPTHNGYPGFDAKKSVANGGQWSFTFDSEGSWTYHNHMEPVLGGTVIVQ